MMKLLKKKQKQLQQFLMKKMKPVKKKSVFYFPSLNY